MIRIIAIVCLVSLFKIASAQKYAFVYPVLPVEGKAPIHFVSDGWELHTVADGFLNGDGLRDYAVVIEKTDAITVTNNDSKEDEKIKPRILALLFKNEDGTYHLALQNNGFIPLNSIPTNMEEPFTAMDINEKGILLFKFTLFANAGSWDSYYYTYRFRYQKNHFELIGADCTYIHRGTGQQKDYSYNFLTKKRSLTKGMMDNPDEPNPAKPTSEWKNIAIQKLKTLEEMNKPFAWLIDKEDNILF